MGKASIDFDGCLSRKDVQKFVKSLVDDGHEVWIVTTRTDTKSALEKGWHWIERQNNQLFEIADWCGIKRERIIFTNFQDKIHTLRGKGFDFHLDDDEHELMEILNSKEICKPINVGHSDFESFCLEALGE